ncbi:MAG: FAD-dependent oxidoreductase [Clostridia bacterium]|nr:FAD-dependent oxidoreductase [Clostridia bacterium]
MKFQRLFEKGKIGNMELRNRVVMPPMGTNLASEIGAVTPAIIHYYRERAKGGVGMIIVEVAAVDSPEGNAIVNELSIHDDAYTPGHNELVEACQQHGAKIVVQLHHAGRQTTESATKGLQPVAPSAVPDPSSGVLPRELSIKEIEDLIDKFAKAAARAKDAGYDGVEIHGAHGYLVGQFISPFSNKRTDLYGGDLTGRMRFPLEIIKKTREAVGDDYPILFRLSVDEFVDGGIKMDEAKIIARMLQDAGIDALDVTSGTYASMQTILEPMPYEEGWRAYLADEIKKEIQIPVITVGVIRSPETAESLLAEGKADFIAVGRTLIADPEWPMKALEGRTEDIRKCITCNIWCIGERLFKNLSLRCTVNPAAGRELEYPYIQKTTSPQSIAIIGGGPAGMEAARTLASAGHKITLHEAENKLGGQVNIAAVPPGKDKIAWSTQYLESQIRKLGVEIHLNSRIDVDSLRPDEFDAIILATGAAPIIPNIPGVQSPHVTTSWEVLAGNYDVGDKVVIVGGGDVGCETGLLLRHRGVDVTVVEMGDELAIEMEPINRAHTLGEMANSGVHTMTGHMVRKIEPDGVTALDKEGNEHWLPCTHVILSVGTAPINHLEGELKQKGFPVYVIGDAREPRKLNHAINEAFLTAHRINQMEPMVQPYQPFYQRPEYQEQPEHLQ